MFSYLDSTQRTLDVELRTKEMRAIAEELRQARRLPRSKAAKPVRRHVGVMLITAGEALAR